MTLKIILNVFLFFILFPFAIMIIFIVAVFWWLIFSTLNTFIIELLKSLG